MKKRCFESFLRWRIWPSKVPVKTSGRVNLADMAKKGSRTTEQSRVVAGYLKKKQKEIEFEEVKLLPEMWHPT